MSKFRILFLFCFFFFGGGGGGWGGVGGVICKLQMLSKN